MAASSQWHPRIRQYDEEKKIFPSKRVDDYPLKPIQVNEGNIIIQGAKTSGVRHVQGVKSSLPSASESQPIDPLSMLAAGNENIATEILPKDGKSHKGNAFDPSSFEPWSSKRQGILMKYTTSEKLSITTSFLSGGDNDRVVVKTQHSLTDKVKNRLEQLDDFEEGSVKEMLDLSQQEYVNRIEELNRALIDAWDQDQRVKALKIAIQCSKLLADTSVIQFYPSKFVLVTDVLDTFGKLVFNRLFEKAQSNAGGRSMKLTENFSPDDIPEAAKETCRNWFYKVASIRELLPRIFVEAAIAKCYKFLHHSEIPQVLSRLGNMIRGIGNPLVATYTRAYIARVGMDTIPVYKDFIMDMFRDFIRTYHQMEGSAVQRLMSAQNVDAATYLSLYSPALDWLLQCVAHGATPALLHDVLDKSYKECNRALLLNSIMSAFRPEFIASRATYFLDMIKATDDTGLPKHVLLITLGQCLMFSDPPEDQRLSVLNETWKIVMKLKNSSHYVSCAEVWINYPCRHFSKREVNVILGDIIKHMQPDRRYEDHYQQLQAILDTLLNHMKNLSLLCSMDKFLPFVDMFQKESVKVEVSKMVMEAFNRYEVEPTADPVTISTAMDFCKIMHDSVNALTLDDERRQIAGLISVLLQRVDFGRDLEHQLTFLVEARASFTNLDAVLVRLVHQVNLLSVRTSQVVRRKHTRKTAAFVRACAAYCFITIPSISSVVTKLGLYLHSGQVALSSHCHAQADAFFKAAISLLADLPRTIEVDSRVKSSEPFMLEYVSRFLSALLAVPDHPEQGVLYLVKGLLNVCHKHQWDPNQNTLALIYCNVIAALNATCQPTYLYHIPKVDANDAMYGNDPKFIGEVKKICSRLVDELLQYIKDLGDQQAAKRQSEVSGALCAALVVHGDVAHESVATLAGNLWRLSARTDHAHSKHLVQLVQYLEQQAKDQSRSKSTRQALAEFVSGLSP